MNTRTALIVIGFVLAQPAMAAGKFNSKYITEAWVKDFESMEPASCNKADVNPTHADVRKYFQRAMVLDEKTLNDNYPVAPCQAMGVLKYKGMWCDWTISAASTASITCGKRKWFFACDDCDDLLIKDENRQ